MTNTNERMPAQPLLNDLGHILMWLIVVDGRTEFIPLLNRIKGVSNAS